MGSPPPEGSKKDVLKFRSVNSIVIAPARTGKANRRRIVVMKIAHVKRGICSKGMFLVRIFIMVEMKLMAPRMELTPAK
jgi:hypothetical protein